jgi:hypothetical protein
MRGEGKRPYTAFPLFCAFLCLLGIVAVTLYSAQHPYYEHERLTVPATFLPLKVFRAEAPIIPTGVKTYPATDARGTLTISNGSVVSQSLPAGLVFISKDGIAVVTDAAIFVPAGSANGFGMSTVSAHLLTLGINMSTLAINQVVGTSLYVRNLSPFTDGRPAYTVKVVTPGDIQTAIDATRALMASQESQAQAFLASPCRENLLTADSKMVATWRCQFATYKVPSYMRVTVAHLVGKSFLVDVVFVPRPRPVWIR